MIFWKIEYVNCKPLFSADAQVKIHLQLIFCTGVTITKNLKEKNQLVLGHWFEEVINTMISRELADIDRVIFAVVFLFKTQRRRKRKIGAVFFEGDEEDEEAAVETRPPLERREERLVRSFFIIHEQYT